MRTIPTRHMRRLAGRREAVRAWAGGWVVEHADGLRVVLDHSLRPVPPAPGPLAALPASDLHLVASATTLDLRATADDELIGRVYWPDDADDEGAAAWVLGGGFACWAGNTGQLYLVDLALMDRVEALHVAPGFQAAVPGPDGLMLTVHGDLLVVTHLADWSPPLSARR